MTGFGDYEPEDTWTVTDTPRELVRNLGRRVALLDGLPEPRGTSLRALLGAIEHRANVVQRRHRIAGRDRLRLQLLRDDIAHVRDRLGV